MAFSEAQLVALQKARETVLTSKIEDCTEKDVFGDPVPGHSVFRKLIKMGLVFETEEDPITLDNGEIFEFTPTYELTDEGLAQLEAALHPSDAPEM